MKLTLLLALAGAAYAKTPAHLLRRQLELWPGTADDVSSSCRSAIDAIRAAAPTLPPSITEFSSSFYETASRTATATELDCAWVTELPESERKEWTDWNDASANWLSEPDHYDLLTKGGEQCETGDLSGFPCEAQWKDLAAVIVDETGWEPAVIEIDLDALSDDVERSERNDKSDNAGPSCYGQIHVVAALLAASFGAVALL